MEFFNKIINNIEEKHNNNIELNEYINNLIKENDEMKNINESLLKDNDDFKNINESLLKENDDLKNINKEIKLNNKNLKTIHKEVDKYEIIKTNINKIITKYQLINWNKNRPVCDVRATEIAKYYEQNNIKIIPGIIYVWYNNNKYQLIDGLHRYTAALKLNKNIKVILHINYSTNEQDIIDEFININKSISIPSIYLENNNIKKPICEIIVKKLTLKYPHFVSPSRKHHISNFNRDLLIEFFSTLNIDFNITNLENKIFDILETLNNQAKHNIITGKIKHPTKCELYDFYLFYLEKHYIKSEIENNIKLLN